MLCILFIIVVFRQLLMIFRNSKPSYYIASYVKRLTLFAWISESFNSNQYLSRFQQSVIIIPSSLFFNWHDKKFKFFDIHIIIADIFRLSLIFANQFYFGTFIVSSRLNQTHDHMLNILKNRKKKSSSLRLQITRTMFNVM